LIPLRVELSEDLESIVVYLPSGSKAVVSSDVTRVGVDGREARFALVDDCYTSNGLVMFRAGGGIVAVEVPSDLPDFEDEMHAELFSDWRKLIRCVVRFTEYCACEHGEDYVLEDIKRICEALNIPVDEAVEVAREELSKIRCEEEEE